MLTVMSKNGYKNHIDIIIISKFTLDIAIRIFPSAHKELQTFGIVSLALAYPD